MLCLFSVQTSISKNKMSATSVLARTLGSGQVWLAGVMLSSDVISRGGWGPSSSTRAGAGGSASGLATASGSCVGIRNAASPTWEAWPGRVGIL